MSDLQRLQEELLALRAEHPELRLRKAPAGAAGAPFPVVVTCPVSAPPEASTIDVDTFKVQATVSCAPPGGGGAAAAAAADDFPVAIEILSPELPDALRHAMAADLQSQRAAAPEDGTLLRLGTVLAAASAGFARLLTLLPDCLELYEAVDAAGRTVRRMAVLKDVEVTIDAAPHAAPMASPRAAPAGAPPGPTLPRVLQAELETLKKRYTVAVGAAHGPPGAAAAAALRGLSIREEGEGGEAGRHEVHFRVSLTPTDPQWVPQGSSLALRCAVLDAGAYPAPGSFSLALDRSDASGPIEQLSEQERAVFNRLLEVEAAGAAGRPGALRAALRQAENRAGELIHQAADIAMEIDRRRAAAAAAGAGGADSEPSSAEDYSEDSDSEGFSGSESGHSSASDAADEEGGHEPAAAGEGGGGSGGGGVLVHNSLNLTLEGLQMVDVDTLDAVKLSLQLRCLRCCAGAEATLTADAGAARRRLEWSGECGTCHAALGLTVALRIVHEGSNVLAVVRPEGVAPADLLPSTFAAQCSSCSGMAAFRAAQVGRWNERDCGSCHRRMAFLLPGVTFAPVAAAAGRRGGGGGGGSAAGPSGGGGPRAHSDRDVVITPGQPLPDTGACRHYRHSHRWLRFPCCGRRFPCDLCHEEGTEDGHEMKWAGRMVCGYCSVEQPAGQRCAVCQRRLASSAARPSGRNSNFWEGGEGQRDKRRLSRNDPHKWRGSKAKTQSRKALRVGQKGKERAERKKK